MEKLISEVNIVSPVPIRPGQKSNFGEKRDYEIHPGADLPVPVGTPVLALMDGKVELTSSNTPLCGATLDIDYGNGFWSRFCHLSKIDVNEGDTVKAGQIVGKSGGKPGSWGAGNSQGPHLHITLKQNGQNVDPLKYINQGYEVSNNYIDDVEKIVSNLKDKVTSLNLDDIKSQFPKGVFSDEYFQAFLEQVDRIKTLIK